MGEKKMISAVRVEKEYHLGETIVRALAGVSAEIEEGEFVVIIGPSGSGKSTLMHLLGALDRPTRGSVLIDGKGISMFDDYELAAVRRNLIGFVFQTFNLIPTLDSLENVLIPAQNSQGALGAAEHRAIKLLKEVGLSDRMHHKPGELSGGQRQRVAIARALINNPKIIFADEPTGNLDSATGKQIIDLMKKLNKTDGKTFVIVTHDLGLLEHATREIHLFDGKIVKDVKRRAREK